MLVCSVFCWILSVANDGPILNGCVVTTPTAPASKELNSNAQSLPVKRSASCGAVTIDDVHQPSTSHQSAASAACGSDQRYRIHLDTTSVK